MYSEYGIGTTFRIYFPRLKGKPDALSQNIELERPQEIAWETILVVEDEVTVKKLLCNLLSREGYQVLHAANGVDALEIFKRSQKTIHLVITDLVMPQMGGRELADELQKLSHPPQILFMSGYTAQVLYEKSDQKEPGFDFLQKPFRATDLANTVRKILNRKQPPSELSLPRRLEAQGPADTG